MEKSAKIYVAGHRGLVGSAIARALTAQGYDSVLTRTRAELDLLDSRAVSDFFVRESPQYVFVAAAKVGGILANNEQPVEFLTDNLQIQNNLLMSAHRSGVEKLLFLGSSCIYPKMAPQPLREDALLTGPLEPTNEAYAIAKIAGIKLCQALHREYGKNFIAAMPTNMYGPNDNFDLHNSHVLPALIRRMHVAKATNAPSVTLWGTGTPRREFLHSDDLAAACLFLMEQYDDPQEFVNIGVGEDVTIRELAELVKETVGYKGALEFDTSKPDGTPRKLMDVSRLHHLGWHHTIELSKGIASVYQGVDKSNWA